MDVPRNSGQLEITFLKNQRDTKSEICKVKFIPVMALTRPWVKGFMTKKKAIRVCSPVILLKNSKYSGCKTNSITKILSRGTVFNKSEICNLNPKTEAFTTSQGFRTHTFNFPYLLSIISTVLYRIK